MLGYDTEDEIEGDDTVQAGDIHIMRKGDKTEDIHVVGQGDEVEGKGDYPEEDEDIDKGGGDSDEEEPIDEVLPSSLGKGFMGGMKNIVSRITGSRPKKTNKTIPLTQVPKKKAKPV